MAVRWRILSARNEDKKRKRLPSDWHEWMNCPALSGEYKTLGCTCDLWEQPKKRTRLGNIVQDVVQ
jgi:hypothetical protein